MGAETKAMEAARTPATGPKECPFVKGEWVRLPNGKVNYLLQGPPPPAPLVVCVHGLNGSTASFASLEPRLQAAGLRVLLFDLYGFGLSATPRNRLDHKTYAEQLAGLLDAVGVAPQERVMLLGFSMGGIITVEFALRYPQRVERVLLIAPGGLLEKAETPCRPLVFGCLRGRCGCCLLTLVHCLACCCHYPLRRVTQRPGFEGHFTPDVREPHRFQHVRRENSQRFAWDIRRSVTSYLRVIKSMPLWSDDFRCSYEGLAQSKVPVLFIWGDDDCTVPWSEVGAEVVDIFSGSGTSCIRLRGAGHGLMIEDAQEVGSCAAAWFTGSQDPAWLKRLDEFKLTASTPVSPSSASTVGRLSVPEPTVMGNVV